MTSALAAGLVAAATTLALSMSGVALADASPTPTASSSPSSSASPVPSASSTPDGAGVGFQDTCDAVVVSFVADQTAVVFTVEAPGIHEDVSLGPQTLTTRDYAPLAGDGRVVVTVNGAVVGDHEWRLPQIGCGVGPSPGTPGDVRVEPPCDTVLTVVIRNNGPVGGEGGFVVTGPDGVATRYEVASGEERRLSIPIAGPQDAVTVLNLRTGETTRIAAFGGACTMVIGEHVVRKPPVVARPRTLPGPQLPMTGRRVGGLAVLAAGLIIAGAACLGSGRLLPQQVYRRRH